MTAKFTDSKDHHAPPSMDMGKTDKESALAELIELLGTEIGTALFEDSADVDEVKLWLSLCEKYDQYLPENGKPEDDEPESTPGPEPKKDVPRKLSAFENYANHLKRERFLKRGGIALAFSVEFLQNPFLA